MQSESEEAGGLVDNHSWPSAICLLQPAAAAASGLPYITVSKDAARRCYLSYIMHVYVFALVMYASREASLMGDQVLYSAPVQRPNALWRVKQEGVDVKDVTCETAPPGGSAGLAVFHTVSRAWCYFQSVRRNLQSMTLMWGIQGRLAMKYPTWWTCPVHTKNAP